MSIKLNIDWGWIAAVTTIGFCVLILTGTIVTLLTVVAFAVGYKVLLVIPALLLSYIIGLVVLHIGELKYD